MPAKRMCVSRGRGLAISSYPWIPEKAELRAGQGQNWELSPSLQQPQSWGRLGLFSGLVWLFWQGETAWHQDISLSHAHSSLETYRESQNTTSV